MTVRLEVDVHRAALLKANRTGTPVAVVVADAAKHVLLPPDPQNTLTLEKATERVLRRVGKVSNSLQGDLDELRELVALGIRAYLNHTPEVPEEERNAASLSGLMRFNRIVDLLEQNIHDGVSILDSDGGEATDATPPADELPSPVQAELPRY